MNNSLDYWHGFQDALDLLEIELKTVKNARLIDILRIISKSCKEMKTVQIEKELEL